MTTRPVDAAKTALLVRHLRDWAPVAVQRARRAVYLHGYADVDGGRAAEAALGAVAGLPGLARGRELSMVAVGDDVAAVARRLAVPAAAAPGLAVHTVGGGTDERTAAALAAVQAARVPVLACLDAAAAPHPPRPSTLAAPLVGRPAELLLVLAAGDGPGPREALSAAGYPLVTAVELAAGTGAAQLVLFATGSGRSLESFKEALWPPDGYPGVHLRDPGDPGRRPVDVTRPPPAGALRAALLGRLASGPATVTELRTLALTATVYRAADATRELRGMLDAGAVTRDPPDGRLGGDVVIAAR